MKFLSYTEVKYDMWAGFFSVYDLAFFFLDDVLFYGQLK